MGTEGKAAPDVDLQSRGLRHATVAVFAVAVLLICRHVTQTSDVDKEKEAGADEEVVGSELWLVWTLLWALWRLLQFGLGCALLVLIVLVVRQRSILYVPVPPNMHRSPKENPFMLRSPERWNLPFKDVYITTEDNVKLHAWLVHQGINPQKDQVPYTFVYFHGNAGNIGHRLDNIRDMHSKLGVNVLIVDYRGYGDSEDGSGPCEAGFMMDAVATYRWLVDYIRSSKENRVCRMSEDRILLFGRSIGGVVAIRLMSDLLRAKMEKPEGALPLPAGLIIENSFTSLRDMAVTLFPFLKFFGPLLRSPLIFDEWRAADALQFLAQNHKEWGCCLMSGQQDQIVPPAQMRQLHELLKQDRPQVLKFVLVKHGGHNDTPTQGGALYWDAFVRFMDSVAEKEQVRLGKEPPPES